MKKSFFLLCGLLIVSRIFAQTSFGIKYTSAWKIDKLVVVISKPDNRCNGDESYTLFVNGDTTIHNLKYFKLYKTGTLYLDIPLIYAYKYCGAVREDDDKVYFIEPFTQDEVLLYDYGIKTGETIQGAIGKGRIVLDIDTLRDGRKKFILTKPMLHAMDAVIIEGIGSYGGFLNEPPIGHYMSNDSYLVCYKENNRTLFTGIDFFMTGCDPKPSRFPINPKATWYINYVSICYPENLLPGDDIFRYHINNDTIIDSKTYYKLYKSGMAVYESNYFYNNVYVGALRDENNKFFYVGKSKTTEEMLYDFDLKVGDTIKSSIGKGSTITKIDTLSDGRKRLKYAAEICAGCCPNNEFIEGIGHWGGIMELPPCIHPCFKGFYLVCYKENNQTLYSNDFWGMFKKGCDPLVVPEIKEEDIRLYPVPADNTITLDFQNNLHYDAEITIFNTDGITVFTGLSSKNSNLNTINIASFSKGIYLLRIVCGKSVITKKILKI